jgi:hypothetical protein
MLDPAFRRGVACPMLLVWNKSFLPGGINAIRIDFEKDGGVVRLDWGL